MSDDRLDAVLEVLISYARYDFTARVPVSDRLDEIDAIATGINVLAEELHGEVASRRELEAAYERLQATQAQLIAAERYVALGQLANGVAHELNNPATWVLLGVRAVRRRLANVRAAVGEMPEVLADLAAIESSLSDMHGGIERMVGVIRDLRAVSRSDDQDPLLVLELGDVVREACQLARPAYHGVVQLVLDLPEPALIRGNRGRLAQLVTNLIVNAAHAVSDRAGEHVIVVSTLIEGSTVLLAVEDTGPGIPEELWERVFEPYFTTKSSEVGTGLGLALVRNIAGRHGGTVRVGHGKRGGARVEVSLPRSLEVPLAHGPAVIPAASTTRGRILIIDDEPVLLRVLEQSMVEEHDVVVASGGLEALELLARDRRFDLIVCDLQMPNVDGVSIHETLARTAPELLDRFVIMSGGAMTPRAASFLERTRPRLLGKPIALDELLSLARSFTVSGNAPLGT